MGKLLCEHGMLHRGGKNCRSYAEHHKRIRRERVNGERPSKARIIRGLAEALRRNPGEDDSEYADAVATAAAQIAHAHDWRPADAFVEAVRVETRRLVLEARKP